MRQPTDHDRRDFGGRRVWPLAYLAPDLTEAILEGFQSPAISLAGLVAQPPPIGWQAQRQLFQTLGG